MKSATILTIGVIVCVATATVGQEAGIRPQVPVVIKHSAWGEDPCNYAVVHNLDPKGDGFLAVKAGPGLHYARIDKLYNGKQVFMCGQKGVSDVRSWREPPETGSQTPQCSGLRRIMGCAIF
jgi:hypothetical protein